MSNLNALREKYEKGLAGAKHIMIIAPTKTGKSDWVTQAAIDGFNILYVDGDNGIHTLLARTAGNTEAGNNVQYFRPDSMIEFLEKMFTNSIFRWNLTQNSEFKSMTAKDDDDCVEIRFMELDNNWILSIDSWSSMVFHVYKMAAKKLNKALGDLDKIDRDIYAISNAKLTYLANLIQAAPIHVIVQAHPEFYERKEKPEGESTKDTKEGDYIIKEVIDIPFSSSKPHGYNLGAKFTDIGWMRVMKNMGKRELDFTVESGRISGGSIATKGDPRGSHSLKNLFFGGKVPVVDTSKGLRFFKASEFKTQAAAAPASGISASGTPVKPKGFVIGKKPTNG